MASNTLVGSYAVYRYSSAFNASQVELLAAGKVPTSSSASGTWSRLFTSADDAATVTRSGEVLELKTQEEGRKDVVIVGSDDWMLTMPNADIGNISTFRDLLQLDPNLAFSTSETFVALDGSYEGKSMLTAGRPYFICHRAYIPSSYTIDTPMLGTGSDPNAMCFVKGGLMDRNMEISLDPNTQQIQNVNIGFIASTGTTEEKLVGAWGLLTASSS